MITLTAVILTLLFAHIAYGKVPANEQAWQYKYKIWMPPVWQRLAQCESGHNPPNWKHDSGTYTGGFGFYIGSWLRFRYPGYPARGSLATPWQQFRVALRIHARYGFTGWGCANHYWVLHG